MSQMGQKPGKAQCEQMFSALPPDSGHCANGVGIVRFRANSGPGPSCGQVQGPFAEALEAPFEFGCIGVLASQCTFNGICPSGSALMRDSISNPGGTSVTSPTRSEALGRGDGKLRTSIPETGAHHRRTFQRSAAAGCANGVSTC